MICEATDLLAKIVRNFDDSRVVLGDFGNTDD